MFCRAASEANVWKKLYHEAQQELTSLMKEAEAAKSEVSKQQNAALAMKQKCLERLNEAKELWKEKFAEKVGEIQRDFERQMAEKDQNFADFKESSDRKTRNLEMKVRNLERQLAFSDNGFDHFNPDGFRDSRRHANNAMTKAADVGDADFDFDTAFDFDLPPGNGPSGFKNFPDDGSKGPKPKRGKADPFSSIPTQKFFTSDQVNKTSGFAGHHGAQPPAVCPPTHPPQVHGSVFAAMSFVTRPSGPASASLRFNSHTFSNCIEAMSPITALSIMP